MKRFQISIFLVMAVLIGFTLSCTKKEEEVPDTETVDTMFMSDDDFIAAMAEAYASLYTIGKHGSFMTSNEVASDEVIIPQRGQDWFDGGTWLRLHRQEYNEGEEFLNNAWIDLYGGINNCNRLIALFERQENPDPSSYIAELKVLRGYFYWQLLDMFGNIPIISSSADGNPNPPTVSRAQVYDFLVNELETEVPQLTKEVGGAIYGRMNYYAAQTLLAKLYLNAEIYKGTAEWSKALNACEEVINSGAYRLETNYFTNFNIDNSGSSENIFAVPYDEVSATGFNLVVTTLHYASQYTWNFTVQPQNGLCTLREFYQSYGDDDLRKGVWGNQKVRGNFFAGPQYQTDGITQLVDSGAEASDPDGSTVVFTPAFNEHFPNALRQAGVRIGKFEFKNGGGADMSNDFPVFRYADVLLMKAEALWRQDQNSGSALALVNQIRGRAGVAHTTELTAANLLAERGRELFYENHRRTDLIRFGKYNDAWEFKPASQPFKNIFPIPSAQLDANVNLTQNPGY